ncbi:Similar to Endochitinase; acc. no. P29029 [Pyronema omphalodes CBS 100304]|uniref:chitinase n=1 Tax=Pyronema omphalodes (strain CBS 100304) TaxID=1076935 RepID=U4LHW9_PYROM|nr:Similar to Endochitinase; acc. no. P29029 [Pyronema omphalodes CBS 100304]
MKLASSQLQLVVVYFGQVKKSHNDSLAALCDDPDVDIVILAFLNTLWGARSLPDTNFWPYCHSTVSGTNLAHCPTYENDIKTCQSNKKKVLLSIGGATMTQSMTDPLGFARNVWNLFGRGHSTIRPFGTAVVDGFDLDIENNDPRGWRELISELRALASPTGGLIMSGAPQCPRPDVSLGDAVYDLDLLFIQFYNNWCGGNNIPDSFREWSLDMMAKNSRAKLFVGVPGSPDAASSGYLPSLQMASLVNQVKGYPNYGGVMTWDWAYAKNNKDLGTNRRNYMEFLRWVA